MKKQIDQKRLQRALMLIVVAFLSIVIGTFSRNSNNLFGLIATAVLFVIVAISISIRIFRKVIPNRRIKKITGIKDPQERLKIADAYHKNNKITDFNYLNIKSIAYLEMGEHEQSNTYNEKWMNYNKESTKSKEPEYTVLMIYLMTACINYFFLDLFADMKKVLIKLQSTLEKGAIALKDESLINLIWAKIDMEKGNLKDAKNKLQQIPEQNGQGILELLEAEYLFRSGNKTQALSELDKIIENSKYRPTILKAEKLKELYQENL